MPQRSTWHTQPLGSTGAGGPTLSQALIGFGAAPTCVGFPLPLGALSPLCRITARLKREWLVF
jgi:hypothetical protein